MNGNAPIRVLIACDHIAYRDSLHGLGRLMIEWVKGFDPARVQVIACCLREPGALGEQLSSEGVHLRFFADAPWNPISLAKLVWTIRREKIDVLHLNSFGANIFGRVAGWLTRTPTIVHVHDARESEDAQYPPSVRWLDRTMAPFTSRAIAISPTVQNFCVEQMGFRPDQVELIPHGTPRQGFEPVPEERVQALRRKYGIADGQLVIGTTSRLFRPKGLHVLLEALPLVLQSAPDARVLIVGDGPMREKLEEEARELGVEHHVTFTGFQRDIAAHLQLFGMTVVPSTWQEPFGLCALESLAAGVPVVASRVGWLASFIEDEQNGLLVPPGEAKLLAQAILRLLGDARLRQRLGANARKGSAAFSMEVHMDRMEAAFRQVARPRSR
jgi:glycosyltransferase involved in cell wall biosynthesis